MKKIDLHSHSYFSDGTLSPKELVLKANADGIDVFALTDHDTISGVIEAEETAIELNLKFIRGIEISAFDEDCKSIHILGLGLKDLSKFKELEATNKESRKKRNLMILDGYNKKYNQNINLDEIEKHFRGTVGNGNLSQFLFNLGIVTDYKEADNLLNEFRASQYDIPQNISI